jgi:predicted nucleic acid-binding protein
MAAKNVPDSGIYIDSTALAKLYVPEPESDLLDRFLSRRTDLMISELSITEVVSAVSRRKREGFLDSRQASKIKEALFADAKSFRRLDLNPTLHRHAEQLLLTTETIPLRTLDALHIALAVSGGAMHIVTFDVRMADAAALHGLHVVELR